MNKKVCEILIGLLFLIPLPASAQFDLSGYLAKEDSVYIDKNGNPLNERFIGDYAFRSPKGKTLIKYRGRISNGKMTGEWTKYSKWEQKVQAKYHYENNHKHGPYFVNHENENHREVGFYWQGVLDSTQYIYYKSGGLHAINFYEKGRLIKSDTFKVVRAPSYFIGIEQSKSDTLYVASGEMPDSIHFAVFKPNYDLKRKGFEKADDLKLVSFELNLTGTPGCIMVAIEDTSIGNIYKNMNEILNQGYSKYKIWLNDIHVRDTDKNITYPYWMDGKEFVILWE